MNTSKSLNDWVVSIQNRELMPDPHSEFGSLDDVIITSSESLVPMHDITALRFLLRQPSPHWKNFGIEDISVIHFIFQCQKKILAKLVNFYEILNSAWKLSGFYLLICACCLQIHHTLDVRKSGRKPEPGPGKSPAPQESNLDVAIRQTRDAIWGRVIRPEVGGEEGGTDEMATPSVILPATYDIMSLQLNWKIKKISEFVNAILGEISDCQLLCHSQSSIADC